MGARYQEELGKKIGPLGNVNTPLERLPSLLSKLDKIELREASRHFEVALARFGEKDLEFIKDAMDPKARPSGVPLTGLVENRLGNVKELAERLVVTWNHMAERQVPYQVNFSKWHPTIQDFVWKIAKSRGLFPDRKRLARTRLITYKPTTRRRTPK